MLANRCHRRAFHSPRDAPPNDWSGGKISTATVSVADEVLVSTESGIVATLVTAVVFGIVASRAPATPRPVNSGTDITAAVTRRERRRDMLPPVVWFPPREPARPY